MCRTFPPAGSCSCGCAALWSLTAAPCASWDPARLALTPSMCVNVFQGRGVVFCQAILEPDGQYCREYLMQDPNLTEALLTYLDDGHATDWLRSQKYTLDFIDYCLRLL